MTDPDTRLTEVERPARELKTMLDAAADHLERNGPVPPDVCVECR